MSTLATQRSLDMKDQADIEWEDDTARGSQPCDNNFRAKMAEEVAKKALDLKKNELKWKLMQVSQAKNLEKLKEIQTAVNYHRRKLSKAQDLAARLRKKYIEVVKSARLNEIQFKAAESQLTQQERFVADEKMQLTKLARDCVSTGSALFGGAYKLPSNPIDQVKTQVPERMRSNINGETSRQIEKPDTTTILEKLSPFLRNARLNANQASETAQQHPSSTCTTTASNSLHGPIRRLKRAENRRLSSIYNADNRILTNLASYRLTNLLGECTDKTCPYQHKSNYRMTDLEKLADLLSYRPQVAGFRPDPDLTDEENIKICRVKVKRYAAKLISRNPNKSAEMIARILVRKVRADATDTELILKRRELPKVSHLKAPPLERCTCEPVDVSGENKDPLRAESDEIRVKLEPMDFN